MIKNQNHIIIRKNISRIISKVTSETNADGISKSLESYTTLKNRNLFTKNKIEIGILGELYKLIEKYSSNFELLKSIVLLFLSLIDELIGLKISKRKYSQMLLCFPEIKKALNFPSADALKKWLSILIEDLNSQQRNYLILKIKDKEEINFSSKNYL